MTSLHCALDLPPDYRMQDVTAFHGRDTEGVAEQTGAAQVRKGLLLDGVAVALDITFSPRLAHCRIEADGVLSASASAQVQTALRNMLGLRIDPAPFLSFTADDPLMGPLTRKRAGLRIIQAGTIFEALSWAIIGQQINLPFAIALRRSLIVQAGRRHSSGLWCYPEAADVARLDSEQLTNHKFSRAKAGTLLRLARLIVDGQLTLTLPASGDIETVSQALLAIQGIGPWSVNYVLLRGYGYADCSLHGDVAIRTALQRLLNEADKPDLHRTEAWLQQYQPHRTMTAAHLWASLHD